MRNFCAVLTRCDKESSSELRILEKDIRIEIITGRTPPWWILIKVDCGATFYDEKFPKPSSESEREKNFSANIWIWFCVCISFKFLFDFLVCHGMKNFLPLSWCPCSDIDTHFCSHVAVYPERENFKEIFYFLQFFIFAAFFFSISSQLQIFHF